MAEANQGHIRLPPDTSRLPRPWSKTLEEALKKDYPSHTFEDAMETLFFEYQKNYMSQRATSSFISPETPQTLSQRQTASVSPGMIPPPYPARDMGRDPTFEITTGPESKRKRRAYTPKEKEQVNLTRKRGACDKCHRSHKKCKHTPRDTSISNPDPRTPGEVSKEFSFNFYLPASEGTHQPEIEPGKQGSAVENLPKNRLNYEPPYVQMESVPFHQGSFPSDFSGFDFSASQNQDVLPGMGLVSWPQGATGSSTGPSFVHENPLGPRLQVNHPRASQRRPSKRTSYPGQEWSQTAAGTNPSAPKDFG